MGESDRRMKSGQRGYRAPGRRGDRAVLVKGGQVSSGMAEPAHRSCEAGGPDKELDRAPSVQAVVEPKRRACSDAECLSGKGRLVQTRDNVTR